MKATISIETRDIVINDVVGTMTADIDFGQYYKGDKGDPGEKGEDGDFGLVATEIDENGHLILYSSSDALDFTIENKHLKLRI